MQAQRNHYNVNEPALFLTTCLEKTTVSCDSVHNLHAMIKLTAPSTASWTKDSNKPTINFVVVVDVSSSMRHHNKLSHVQATIEYMLNQLESHHSFAVIQFNETARLLTDGLVALSDNNKQTILQSVKAMQPNGSTNISEALLLALKTLQQHQGPTRRTVLSSVLLFTDGLANMGKRGTDLVKQLKSWNMQPYCDHGDPTAIADIEAASTNTEDNFQMNIDSTISINTFGYGCDHDSTLLQSISLLNGGGGVYYYIQNTNHIATTFAQCMAGIVNTVAHNISISLSASDGCRFVRFCTPFKLTEKQQNKQYLVEMGSMYREESRTLLFKLSLRNMKMEMQHTLAHVTVTCTNSWTGERTELTTSLAVSRPKVVASHSQTTIPVELDMQLNRFATAQCLMDGLQQASHDGFSAACEHIVNAITAIRSSQSSTQPYCKDLVSDLTYCLDCVKDSYSFNIMGGKHIAVALATMYLLERSTGAAHIIMDLINNSSNNNNTNTSNVSINFNNDQTLRLPTRTSGYGYMTAYQESECARASAESKKLLSRYLPMYEVDCDHTTCTVLGTSRSCTISSPASTTTTTNTQPATGLERLKMMNAYLPEPSPFSASSSPTTAALTQRLALS